MLTFKDLNYTFKLSILYFSYRWKNVKSTLTRQYTLINDADVSEFFEVIIKVTYSYIN